MRSRSLPRAALAALAAPLLLALPVAAEWQWTNFRLVAFHFGCVQPSTVPATPSCSRATLTVVANFGFCSQTSWSALAASDPTGLLPVGSDVSGQLLIQHGLVSNTGSFPLASCTTSLEAELGRLCTALPEVELQTWGAVSAQTTTLPTAGSTTLSFVVSSNGGGVLEIEAHARCPEGYGPFSPRGMSDLTVEEMRAVYDEDTQSCSVEIALENLGETAWDGDPSFFENSAPAFLAVQLGEANEVRTFRLGEVDPESALDTGSGPVIWALPDSEFTGAIQVTATIDSTNVIVEPDETNQTLVRLLSCGPPESPALGSPLQDLLAEIERLEYVRRDRPPWIGPTPCPECSPGPEMRRLTELLRRARAREPYTLLLVDRVVGAPVAFLGRWNPERGALEAGPPRDLELMTTRRPPAGCRYALRAVDRRGRVVAERATCLDPRPPRSEDRP